MTCIHWREMFPRHWEILSQRRCMYWNNYDRFNIKHVLSPWKISKTFRHNIYSHSNLCKKVIFIQYNLLALGIVKYKFTSRIYIWCWIFRLEVIQNGYPKTGSNLFNIRGNITSRFTKKLLIISDILHIFSDAFFFRSSVWNCLSVK